MRMAGEVVCLRMAGEVVCLRMAEGSSACGWPEGSSACGWPEGSSACGWPEGSSACGWPEGSSACGWPEGSSACGWPERSSACGWPERSSACGWPEKSSACGWPGRSSADGDSPSRMVNVVILVRSGSALAGCRPLGRLLDPGLAVVLFSLGLPTTLAITRISIKKGCAQAGTVGGCARVHECIVRKNWELERYVNIEILEFIYIVSAEEGLVRAHGSVPCG